MSNEDIIAIIKWGPLALFLVIFLIGMLTGLIKGRRKVVRRFIYVILFVVLIFLFTPKISELLLTIKINGNSVESYINDFISNNETIQNICNEIPGLDSIIKVYPQAIVSLVLFVVLILVGLPLSFPIYIFYCIIYNLIQKYVFKYSKYERDENGKILRNEKKKKIKKKENKHRLTAGILKGVEGVLVTSVIFVPIGVVTRLYMDAKESSESGNLSNIEYLSGAKDILTYVDAFNDSLFGKITNSKVSEGVAGYLSPIEINGNKSTVEKELSNVVVAAVYLEESGLLKLLSGNIDILTLDLSKLNIDKMEKAIEMLFGTSTLNAIVSDGVNYILSNYLKETLVDFSNDGNIMDKIKYSDANEVKTELLRVTSILRDIINAKLLESYQGSNDNIIGVVNQINAHDVEVILNKVLSVKILSECMPGIMTKLLQDYGLTSNLVKEDNGTFITVLMDAIKLVQTLQIENLEQITEGNILENVVNVLYKEGAIKEASMDSLAKLLSDINSARVFDEILVAQLNNLLEKYEINLNAQMIANVKSKEDWKRELLVLENICELYDLYNKEDTVDFLVATELLENIKNSKAMLLALPIAYQKLFPQIGIEADLEKIKYIDYTKEDVSEKEIEFYSYWSQQVVHLENIADEMAKLEITSISDISLDLLDMQENVVSLSNILAEVFSADLLKDGVTTLITDTMKDLLKSYEITLNDDAIENVNDLVNTVPYYIMVGNEQVGISCHDNKYYIGNEEVNIVDNKVTYNSQEYEVKNNSLSIVWKGELTNLSNVVSAIKTDDYTSKENLTIILDSVDSMYLLKDVKNDLLIYAVKQVDVLDSKYLDGIDKENLSFTKEKNILLDVIDEYDMLKDMSDLNFATISDDEITTLSGILISVMSSDIFGDYAADTVVDLASKEEITLDKNNVKTSTTWEADLKLMRTALNMDVDSFDEPTITSLLTGIKLSTLLGPIKEQLLLDTAKQISIDGIAISSTLKAEDLDFDVEEIAIIAAARHLNLVKTLSDINVSTMDTEPVSDLLTATINSKLFGDSVVNKLVTTFNKEGISHDLDNNTTNNFYLVSTIKSIKTKENWEVEFDIIKSLLEVDTKDEVTSNLFDTLENESVLLGGCRANLLVRMVTEIKTKDTSLDLSEISVQTLVGNDNSYTQYNIEKNLLINVTKLDGIDDISDINDGNKGNIADALDYMKDSVIFDKEYDELLSTMTDPIESIEVDDGVSLSSWDISVDSDPVIASWSTELDALLTIQNNMSDVANYDLDTAKNNTEIIGATLDAIDNSDIISGSENVAGKLVDKLLGTSGTVVNKDQNTTWEDYFDTLFGNN